MAKRIRELLKDLLIFILVIAIVVLTLMALPTKTLTDSPILTTVLKPFARFFGISQAELAVKQDSASLTAAAQPLAISLKNPGGRFTGQYSFAELDNAYEALGGALAQALGSCQAPAESSRKTLYDALSGTSIAFSYPGMIPCGVLAGWLGTQTAADGVSARFYALCVENEIVTLYLVSDKVYQCKTDCSAADIRELCGSSQADGSFFAFESDEPAYAALDGLSLLPAEAPVLQKITSQTPCDSRFLTALASDLGFNPYSGSSYQDKDGTMHYTESSASLEVTSDGVLTLENSDPSRLDGYHTDAASRIFAASALLKSMLGTDETEARLYLCGYAATENGGVCSFRYVVDGVPILPMNDEISVEFTDGYVSAVHAVLRTYFASADTLAVLPPKQAATISGADTDLRIFYAEAGQASLSAGWAK